MIWLSYLATVLVLLGVYQISKPRLKGQYIMIAADSLWVIYAVFTKQWALAAQSAALLYISTKSIANWRREWIKF